MMMKMRKCQRMMAMVTIVLLSTVSSFAQDNKKFDPEKFKAHQRSFIAQAASLSAQEAAAFFPLFDEMQQKERAIFDKQRKLWDAKPATEEGCLEAIRSYDQFDQELKGIQKSYHQKFLKVLPASKVYDCIHASNKFHRETFKKMMKPKRPEH